MDTKRKIALALCSFLTIAPIIGSFFSADKTLGQYIGNWTPYLHLSMTQLGGPPFGELIGGLFGTFIFLLGLIGLIIFLITKYKKTSWLLLLLYITIIYCSFRALFGFAFNIATFNNYDAKTKIFIVTAILFDIAWGIFCYWAITILAKEKVEIGNKDLLV